MKRAGIDTVCGFTETMYASTSRTIRTWGRRLLRTILRSKNSPTLPPSNSKSPGPLHGNNFSHYLGDTLED